MGHGGSAAVDSTGLKTRLTPFTAVWFIRTRPKTTHTDFLNHEAPRTDRQLIHWTVFHDVILHHQRCMNTRGGNQVFGD